MPRQIGSSPDRRRRSIVQIVVARHSPSSPSEIARRSSWRCLVTEFASAFRPPCLATPVLPPSRYFIFLSLFLFDSVSVSVSLSLSLSLLNEMKIIKWIKLSLSLSLSLFFNKTYSLCLFKLSLSFLFVFLNVLLSCVVCLSVYLNILPSGLVCVVCWCWY